MRVSDNGRLLEWRRCCQAYDWPKPTQQISQSLRVSICTSTSSTCNYVVNLTYGRAVLEYNTASLSFLSSFISYHILYFIGVFLPVIFVLPIYCCYQAYKLSVHHWVMQANGKLDQQDWRSITAGENTPDYYTIPMELLYPTCNLQ